MDETAASRLKLFIDTSGLTVSEFADMCGISRPTLSQILGGRNKKISDILVGQIHRTFPDLSVVWLLFGEGPVKVSALGKGKGISSDSGSSYDSASVDPLRRLDEMTGNNSIEVNIDPNSSNISNFENEYNPELRRNNGDSIENSNVRGLNTPENKDNTLKNQLFTSDLKIMDLQGQIDQMRKNPRKVLQITIYYDDSTFETFFPK